MLEDFEDLSDWKPAPADGVRMGLVSAPGVEGRGMRLDFEFAGAGYAIARRAVSLELPENYEFSFRMRGEGPRNTLEFKLLDETGENVWWMVRRDIEFPREWETVTIKKRHLSFAWGPAGGGEPKRVSAIELVVTASGGGKGSVNFDELTFRELPKVQPYKGRPSARASSSTPAAPPPGVLDGQTATAWRSDPSGGDGQWLEVDFGEEREFGGVVLHWDGEDFARRYAIDVSEGGGWSRLREVVRGNGGLDYLFLPESQGRRLRLLLSQSARGRGYALREITVEPLEAGSSKNAFFRRIASGAPRGRYPRSLKEQSYWTVVGVDGDAEEGLLNEDGALEVGKQSFTIEPFLFAGGSLVSWNDVERAHSLADGYLPVPTVRWKAGDLTLEVTAFAAGSPGRSRLWARHRVRAEGRATRRVTLYLALRPFQVNPPWQFLNTPGGVAEVRQIAWDGKAIRAAGRTIVATTPPSGFGAAAFDEGDVTEYLAKGALPPAREVSDPFGHASGALSYELDLVPGPSRDVFLAVPLGAREDETLPDPQGELSATLEEWRKKLGRVTLTLPPSARDLADTLRSNLAYVLINRDGPAIQPGSRSYERSWIRDGALTSAALLRLGHPETVKAFIEWYAPYQYPDGKVPCCVDRRGADPVPEHDSHGELIYLIAEYFRFTGDRALAEKMWPHLQRAVAYLDDLRRQRRTEEYRRPEKIHFFGLLPESISHEGYSAKPVHSYWDDFFALKGFKDAIELASALGREEERRRWTPIRDEFRTDLYASIRRAMEKHRIGFIPGSADLGDFDATSTTIALAPGGELENLPREALRRTFERYWSEFVARRAGKSSGKAYTPYELRTIGSFVRLGWRKRAHELLKFFLRDRRPAGWNHWAEVVWRDPRAPEFIGDMPHTWVGSDFIRSFLDFFAYDREADGALVLGAGIPAGWATQKGGVGVRGLRTPHGTLDYAIVATPREARISIGGDLRLPAGGLVLAWPFEKPPRAVDVGGRRVPLVRGEVVLREHPALVVISR